MKSKTKKIVVLISIALSGSFANCAQKSADTSSSLLPLLLLNSSSKSSSSSSSSANTTNCSGAGVTNLQAVTVSASTQAINFYGPSSGNYFAVGIGSALSVATVVTIANNPALSYYVSIGNGCSVGFSSLATNGNQYTQAGSTFTINTAGTYSFVFYQATSAYVGMTIHD